MLRDRRLEAEPEQGTTLLEVLVALAMLAVLTTTVLAIFSPTALWISKARNETTAANYAAALLEDLRDKRSLLQAVNDIAPEDLGLAQPYKPALPAGINARIDMEVMAGYGGLYKVEVSVNWSEGSEQREVKMTTLMRRV